MAVASLIAMGVANRVLYKLALVPMQHYVFFLAQSLAVSYVVVYGTMLWARYRAGIVTPAMLRFAASRWRMFLGVGLCDTASQVLGFVGAAQLPGVLLPLLSQTFMVWQLIFNRLLLGRRFSVTQLAGVAAVVVGVSLAAGSTQQQATAMVVPLAPALLYLLSVQFPALVSVIKEGFFADARRALGGQQIDIFVVNTSASVAQMLCTLCTLPLLAHSRGITDLPKHIGDGLLCLRGVTPSCGADCSGAPLLPVLYIASNVAFNVLALYLLRTLGSVSVSLTIAPVVPLTVAAFALLPLPLLPPVARPSGVFVAGVAVLLAGIALYNVQGWGPTAAARWGWGAAAARGPKSE